MTTRKTTRIDMHVHTRGSDGFGSPADIVKYALRAKLDGLVITDHHRTYTPEGLEVAQALRDAGLLAFHGAEYSTAWGHLLVYGVDVAQFTWWGFYPHPQTVIQDVVEAGGVCVPAHPFKGYKRRYGDRVKQLKSIVGIETANGQCTFQAPYTNKQAARVASDNRIVTFGGSDAHNPQHIGLTYTQFQTVIRTEAELLRAMRFGQARAVTSKKLVQAELQRRSKYRAKPAAHAELLPGISLDNYGESGQFSMDGAAPINWWRDAERGPAH